MQIVQAQVGNIVYPLIEGQPLPITPGETIKVSYAFKYRMAETTTIRIWASLYYYTLLGVFEREEKAQTKETLALDKSTEWKTYSGNVDIAVRSDCTGDIYGLVLELPDYPSAIDKIEACISVTTTASGIWGMIGQILPLMIMMVIVNAVTSLTTPKGQAKAKK